MKIEIKKYNIEKFKKWCKRENIIIDDEHDLEYELNRFIELNLGLII
jgi:hypothetical protein